MLGNADYLRQNTRLHPNTKTLLDYSLFTLKQPTAIDISMSAKNIGFILSSMCKLHGVNRFVNSGDIVYTIYELYTRMFGGVICGNVGRMTTTNRVMCGFTTKPNSMVLHEVRIDRYNVRLGMNIGDTVVYRFYIGCDPNGPLPRCVQLGVLCAKDTPWPSILFDPDKFDNSWRYNDLLEMYQIKKLNDCTNDLTETHLLDVSTFAYRFNQINDQTTCYTYVCCNYTNNKSYIDDGGVVTNLSSTTQKLGGHFDIYISKERSVGDISITFGRNGELDPSPAATVHKSVAGNQQYWAFIVCKGVGGYCAFKTGVWVHKSDEPYDKETW